MLASSSSTSTPQLRADELLEAHGGESWQDQKRLVEEGRWDELFPGPGRDVDEVVEELLI
jgi:hypothetical protein